MSTPELDVAQLADRFTLRMFVEACAVLEDGEGTLKDIDMGMLGGAGFDPPPFVRADRIGLDKMLASLERAELEWGETFTPPLILKRLVEQGRLGVATGQGFYPYPRPDIGWDDSPVKLESRGQVAIAWLDRPPANSISPDMVSALHKLWDEVVAGGVVRVLVFASANLQLFCAGADIKAFTKMDESSGRALVDGMHSLLRGFERSEIVTIAAVNALAYGGGCELETQNKPPAAEYEADAATGFGGTQRLPRLVGTAKALEMNLSGDPISADDAYESGLVNRLVADHELFDTTLAWARKLASQAPVAVGQIKQVSGNGDLDAGIEAEKDSFVQAFASEDAREGIGAFLQKRAPKFTGK